MTTKLANGEYSVKWTCPGCGSVQHDSVSPEYGPFITCTCSDCGKSFGDENLDAESLLAWEIARQAAEADPAEVGGPS